MTDNFQYFYLKCKCSFTASTLKQFAYNIFSVTVPVPVQKNLFMVDDAF